MKIVRYEPVRKCLFKTRNKDTETTPMGAALIFYCQDWTGTCPHESRAKLISLFLILTKLGAFRKKYDVIPDKNKEASPERFKFKGNRKFWGQLSHFCIGYKFCLVCNITKC